MQTGNTAVAGGSMTPERCEPSTWLEYRDLWHRASALEVLTTSPLHLDVELTSACNLRCSMCWQDGLLETPKGYMAADLYHKIIDEAVAQGTRSIKLQVRGESLLHPKIHEFAQYAKDAGILDIQLTTNGTLLNTREKIEKLLDAPLEKLVFSIDPEHDKSAREIYGEKAADIREIFRRTAELKKDRSQDRPLLRVQTFVDFGVPRDDHLEELKVEFPDANEYIINFQYESRDNKDSLAGLRENFDFLPCSYLWDSPRSLLGTAQRRLAVATTMARCPLATLLRRRFPISGLEAK